MQRVHIYLRGQATYIVSSVYARVGQVTVGPRKTVPVSLVWKPTRMLPKMLHASIVRTQSARSLHKVTEVQYPAAFPKLRTRGPTWLGETARDNGCGEKKTRANVTRKMRCGLTRFLVWHAACLIIQSRVWLPHRLISSCELLCRRRERSSRKRAIKSPQITHALHEHSWNFQGWYSLTPALPTQSHVPSSGSSQSHSQQLARPETGAITAVETAGRAEDVTDAVAEGKVSASVCLGYSRIGGCEFLPRWNATAWILSAKHDCARGFFKGATGYTRGSAAIGIEHSTCRN